MWWTMIIQAAQQLGGLGLDAYQASLQEEANKSKLTHDLTRMQYNKHIAELSAARARERGAEATGAHRAQVRQIGGSQRAQLAASGVMVGAGSAADMTRQTAFLGELDALTIKENADLEAWAYEVKATDIQADIQLAETEKKNLRWQRNFSILSSMLARGNQFGSSLGNYFSNRYQPTGNTTQPPAPTGQGNVTMNWRPGTQSSSWNLA